MRRSALIALASALGLALLLAGCATPLKIAASADPLSILQGGSLVYARLSGAATLKFARSALPAAQAKALSPLLDRTRVLALGLGSPEGKGALDPPSFQACLIGDFPFRAAALSLGSKPGWKREKNSFFNASLGLRAAIPGPNLVLASSGPLEPLFAAAKAPGVSPIPHELEGLSSAQLLFWLPEPFSGLGASLLGVAMPVPARGLLVAATPEGQGYEATVVFVMEDSRSAKIYRPILKLAWLGLARYLFADAAQGDSVPAASFALEGNTLRATGLKISAAQMGLAFTKLAARAGEASKAK